MFHESALWRGAQHTVSQAWPQIVRNRHNVGRSIVFNGPHEHHEAPKAANWKSALAYPSQQPQQRVRLHCLEEKWRWQLRSASDQQTGITIGDFTYARIIQAEGKEE